MTIKYDITEMEDSLKNATFAVLEKIRRQFQTYLSELSTSGLSPDKLKQYPQLAIDKVSDYSSTNIIHGSQGFYIICTDHLVVDNICTFSLQNKPAIYRGECSSVRRRIESHLFNSKYQDLYEQRKKLKLSNGGKFSEPYYGACIKVDPKVSGINIDEAPYNQSNWFVIVLKMQGSSSQVRKQAELAFDILFGKPIASRE